MRETLQHVAGLVNTKCIDARGYALYRVATMNTFREVIDAWPSPAEFGRDVGTTNSHARTMRARNSIPSGLWTIVVEKAFARGLRDITLELLASLAEAKRDTAHVA